MGGFEESDGLVGGEYTTGTGWEGADHRPPEPYAFDAFNLRIIIMAGMMICRPDGKDEGEHTLR